MNKEQIEADFKNIRAACALAQMDLSSHQAVQCGLLRIYEALFPAPPAPPKKEDGTN